MTYAIMPYERDELVSLLTEVRGYLRDLETEMFEDELTNALEILGVPRDTEEN